MLQGISSKKSYVDMSTVDVETVIDIHDVSVKTNLLSHFKQEMYLD